MSTTSHISPALRWMGWGIVSLTLAMLLRRVWLMELDSFEFDDAFMFIRYAEIILAGHGYTWNPGDPALYGNTSILYTYVIAGVKAIGGDWMSNSWVLVTASLSFALFFLLHLQQQLFRALQSPWLKDRLMIALLTLPLLVFPLIFGFQISTGMETTMSLFMHGVFIFAVWTYGRDTEPDNRNLTFAVLAAFILYYIRPDNALGIAGFPAILLLSQRKYGHLMKLGIGIAVLVGIDLFIKYQWFGDVLPLSYYTKQSGFTEGYTAKYFWNPVKYITQIIAYMMPYILLLFLFARKKHRYLLLAFLIPPMITFAYYFSFDQIMGFNARLYFPFIPYILIPGLFVLDDFLRSQNKASYFQASRMVGRYLFLLVFLVITVFSKYRFINMYENYAIRAGNKEAIAIPGLDERKYNREVSIRKISELLKEFPEDFVFAATEHGYISGDNPKTRILDLSGLHNRQIAYRGYEDELLREERPDLIWMPHQDLTVLHHAVRTGEYFQSDYEYIPDIYAFGCAVRKDSKYYEALMDRIK